LVSDEDGDCHAEFRYHPMTMDSVLNRMRDKQSKKRIEEEESFRLMIERHVNGESTPPPAASAVVVSEEDRDEGDGYDEGWSDGQSAWDVEMPDHISLVSDEDGDCHAEFRYHPMTMDSVLNRMRDKQSKKRIEEEESFQLMIESYFNGETTPPAPPPAAAAVVVVVREEYRDEGGGYDDANGGGVRDSDNNVSDVAMALSEVMTQEKQRRQEEGEEEDEEEEVHKAVMMYFGISEI
jgi:phenylpropionate dioxygenase-like ring-hydroxylating dioxygenase large terminal subunit